ncbi:MAG: hypothetical protein ABJE99_13795 [Roseobacter sp.]
MAFDTDGNIALKTREFLRCGDDVAVDVLGWSCILGRPNASRWCCAQRTSETEGEHDA